MNPTVSPDVEGWAPDTWRARPAAQQPDWPDPAALDRALAELARQPPLVFAGEARTLQAALGTVAAGHGFLLQAGDCAESFDAFSADTIRDKLKVILQMAVLLTYGAGLPVVKLGRIAGQFAKPRSAPAERVGGVELPVYRGDMVNDLAPVLEARRPDPARMLRAYHQSSATLNLLRAFTKGGFADLNQVHTWNQEFVAASPAGQRYEAVAGGIDRALRFMAACGIDLTASSVLHQVDFYTSHEALLLGYEQAMTRRDSLTGCWYDCSAHLLWVVVRAVRDAGHPVVWTCDPMHGNTFVGPSGHKTRRFDDVMRELAGFFAVHRSEGSHPGGIHVELTGEDVTECLGGADEIEDGHLHRRYETACDPRLNASQALELAFQVTELLRG